MNYRSEHFSENSRMSLVKSFSVISSKIQRQFLVSTLSYTQHHKNETHFGFETVLESEKEDRVYAVFENVAETYDVMNDSMSLGVHRLWKDYFIDRMAPIQGTNLLDVAGGTGDIAFRFLKYLDHETNPQDPASDGSKDNQFDIEIPESMTGHTYVELDTKYSQGTTKHAEDTNNDRTDMKKTVKSHVTVCDINQAMLDVGKKRADHSDYKTGISWVQGNAECLPVADNSYDAYTIAFGIRNCTHIDKVLREAHRVLRPGGRFMCLEFSQVTNPVLSRLYDGYSFQVIPVMGQLIAGDWNSYQYLVESIRKFPDQESFATMVREAGFKAVTYENLMFGVSAIHSGFKL